MTEPMKSTDAGTDQPNEQQKAYDDAVAKMTDQSLLSRVRAYHPHANTSADALKAMVDDYDRLKAEAEQRPA